MSIIVLNKKSFNLFIYKVYFKYKGIITCKFKVAKRRGSYFSKEPKNFQNLRRHIGLSEAFFENI